MHFCGGLDGKESACNEEDTGLIPRSGRSPGEGKGNPVQYSCLGSPMDRGTWTGLGWRSIPANIRQRGKCIHVQGRLPLTVDWMTGQLKGKLADHWFPGWTQLQGPNTSAHPSAPYLLEAVSTLLFEWCLWHFKRRKVSRILRYNNRKTECRHLFFTSLK